MSKPRPLQLQADVITDKPLPYIVTKYAVFSKF